VSIDQLATYLIDSGGPSTAKAFIDRLLLRLFNSPELILHLKKVGLKRDQKTLQLVFATVPNEVITDIQRIISSPCRVIPFSDEGDEATSYIGFEIPLPKKAPDFSGRQPD
jgi:hypothetical protein